MSKWRLGSVWEHCEGEKERRSRVWLESGFAENSTLHSSFRCLRLVVESSTLFLVINLGRKKRVWKKPCEKKNNKKVKSWQSKNARERARERKGRSKKNEKIRNEWEGKP
jgi:hypothetical protein